MAQASRGKGKKVVTGKQGPGRPTGASRIGEFGKDSSPIKSFFSQPAKLKSPRKDAKPDPQAQSLLELEQNLVSVEGITRTEARHLAMATMASLQGANVEGDLEAAETGVGVGEGKGLGVEGKDGVEEQFLVMLTTTLCQDIPPHELNVLKNMWGRGDIIIDGQPPMAYK